MPVADRQRALSRTLTRLDKTRLRELGRDVNATSTARALTYTSDDGKTQVMPILLAPALLAKSDATYLHQLVLTLNTAVAKTAAARQSDPAVRQLLPLSEREEEWLRLAPTAPAPLIGRFDLNIDPAKGAKTANVLEFNGCAIGGLHYGPAASETILERVVPLSPTPPLRMPGSMTAAWLEQCATHARSLGRTTAKPHIVWLEDRAWETGITEGPTLVEALRRGGHRASVCDPRDLQLVKGEIVHDGAPVDIVYRAIELRDLLAIEDESGPLTVMRKAVAMNRVLSPLAGDLDHKSLLEVWTSDRFNKLFTRHELTLLRRHVLWTRLVSARRTDSIEHREVDLVDYLRKQRVRLVLKPIRACGGEGILVGRDTPQDTWDRAIARSISGKAPLVAQQFIKSAMIESPVVRGTRIKHEKHYTNFGLFASPTTLGILGRAAPFPVVNVSRGGGVLAVLLA